MSKPEFKNFYPFDFSSYAIANSTGAIELTSGNLTIGNVYFIKDSVGENTLFPGADNVEVGVGFIATDTTAVFDGATIVDVTEGKPTEINFYTETPLHLTFKWKMGYNANEDCAFWKCVDAQGNQIN